jgi:uncharacterized protein YbjQ (UPF0145 family)
MRRTVSLGVLALVLILAGCQTVTFQGISVITKVPAYTVVKEFSITIADPHLLGGLVPMGQPDQKIFETIKAEIEKLGGNGAIDVELDYGYTPIDFVLTMLTGNIYNPRTITITGTAVKYK